MAGDKLTEPELQAWFERVTFDRSLVGHIIGIEALQARLEQLQAERLVMEAVTREGLVKASRIYGVLADSDHLSADRSVAAPGLPQLRPDLLLTSDIRAAGKVAACASTSKRTYDRCKEINRFTSGEDDDVGALCADSRLSHF